MSFLENVTELMNECEVSKPKGADEGDGSDDDNVKILTSNDKLIKQQLEEEGFTVILLRGSGLGWREPRGAVPMLPSCSGHPPGHCGGVRGGRGFRPCDAAVSHSAVPV
jgi:hypothetical protein